jgi:hypothetical protein
MEMASPESLASEHQALADLSAKFECEKKAITTSFIHMAQYHMENYEAVLSFDYNDTIRSLYDRVAFHSLTALELFRGIKAKHKNKKDVIIGMLEDLPRTIGGYNVPLTLDLVFRADGHAFSKLFGYYKKVDLQPFSLAITKAFISLALKFAQTNEFSGMDTFYLCSDEITGII